MAKKMRHTVSTLGTNGQWEVTHSPWSLLAGERSFESCVKKIKKEKQGGIRLLSPDGSLLKEFVYKTGKQGEEDTIRTSSQLHLI